MSKRLAFLEKMLADGKADSFGHYCLALEYKGLERVDDALRTFELLRAKDPGYVPMFLMCGTMLLDAGRNDAAREWLEAGVAAASKAGDTKALGELRDPLARAG
jgi:predicted Zn-dependent protease